MKKIYLLPWEPSKSPYWYGYNLFALNHYLIGQYYSSGWGVIFNTYITNKQYQSEASFEEFKKEVLREYPNFAIIDEKLLTLL
jgi:hypothetical protein